jgi:hypothetical protein
MQEKSAAKCRRLKRSEEYLIVFLEIIRFADLTTHRGDQTRPVWSVVINKDGMLGDIVVPSLLPDTVRSSGRLYREANHRG